MTPKLTSGPNRPKQNVTVFDTAPIRFPKIAIGAQWRVSHRHVAARELRVIEDINKPWMAGASRGAES
jgi:hypothetical protein